MNAFETIIALTFLVESGLALLLLWRDSNKPTQRTHVIAPTRKFLRSRRDSQGTWVID